jgi:2-iminobutanoate/2-iminopropanoate deaminase
VFTAGQIGLDPETGQIVSGGVVAEFDRAVANVRAILEAGGASLASVVKVTVFFADLSDFAAVNERYATWFPEPFPARSAIQAAALPKGARIEVEAIAVVP